MRRLVLHWGWLVAVAVSATGATACGGGEGPPHVAPGTPVGKVVEVAGQVTATRDGKTRTLAAGEDVSPDDLIATTDTGSVSIELFHNRANLQLQNGATSRVDDSLAWELTRSDVAKLPGGKVMVSAGRHGEHRAADRVTTIAPPGTTPPPPEEPAVGGLPEPGDDSKQEESKPEPIGRQGATGTAAGSAAERRPSLEKGRKLSPPPQPTKPANREETRTTSPGAGSGPSRADESPKAAEPTDKDKTAPTDDTRKLDSVRDERGVVLHDRVEAMRTKLAACLADDLTHLTITVTVTAGKLTFGFAESGGDAARPCVQRVLARLDLKNADGTATIEIAR